MPEQTQVPQTEFHTIEWKGQAIRLECKWVGMPRSEAPVVVFLHEALGSVALWKNFPERFCSQHGLTGLVFSRYGYGRSTPRAAEAQSPETYMQDEIYGWIPALFKQLGIEKPWLFGHSEGGIAALMYAAAHPDNVHGIIAVAPHVFVDDLTIKGIEDARELYYTTDFRLKLRLYHDDPDTVFSLWTDTWLAPAFRSWSIEDQMPRITCPALVIQGEDDEFGTLDQIYRIQENTLNTQLLILPNCGHFPHRDMPERLIQSAGEFIKMQSITME